MTAVGDAVAAGVLPGRVWLYANYHCNLACAYCLTESSPGAPRRELAAGRMVAAAREAAGLGFTHLGVTGGEPFMLPWLPEALAELARILPLVVLTNAMLLTERRLDRLTPLAELPAAIQVSLDAAEPEPNDALRGAANHAAVIDAIPRLVGRGLRVLVATTVDPDRPADADAQARLCALHRRLGVADDDHVVRPIVRRGRARTAGLGVTAPADDVPPELTVTAEGAFYSPFAPTVEGGRLDTDLLLTRTTQPLATPAAVLLRLLEGRPPGADARLGIR
jgi:MoaA/NifB/PqqE/SkfB family radical SAM enzyme